VWGEGNRNPKGLIHDQEKRNTPQEWARPSRGDQGRVLQWGPKKKDVFAETRQKTKQVAAAVGAVATVWAKLPIKGLFKWH